ncbi:MAG: hypothetical protein ACSLFM_09110, partial [Tepidiformaceae bacterium]
YGRRNRIVAALALLLPALLLVAAVFTLGPESAIAIAVTILALYLFGPFLAGAIAPSAHILIRSAGHEATPRSPR